MPLVAGQSLTHYAILGPLGSGGMGEVYRARDTRLGREVAIKVLPDELAGDDERLRRFEREAKALASLNHVNVAHVYGIDQVEDTCFMVMELVPGEDLAARVARGPLPMSEAVDVCRQIAGGLEAAHRAGVIHRDLKPANVVVTPDGEVKVLDFGVAKVLGEESTLGGADSSRDAPMTQQGHVLGTPPYMSPEQARGDPIDRSSDVWALGCVLFECLTGVRAFRGARPVDVLASILREDPDWSRLPSDTPPQLRAFLRRALDKDAATRIRDAGEVRRLLDDVGVRVSGRDPSPRRFGVLAVVATAALAVLWFVSNRSDGDDPASPISKGVADAARNVAIAVLPFENLSGDPDTQPFVNGLHEDLVTRLSNVGGLTVISKRSTARFAGASRTIPEIARELGAEVVLEARVQRSGEAVRLTAQLTDADTDRNLWGEQLDEDFTVRSVFDVQARLVERIAADLAGKLTAGERSMIRSPSTTNPQAFEAYVRGRDSWLGLTDPSLRRALRYFDDAIARDADFALAYAAKADTYLAMEFVGVMPLDEAVELAGAAVERALDLDADLPEARSAFGHVLLHERDGPGAEIELRRAVDSSSSFLEARMLLGMALLDWGRLSDARFQTEAARRIDPLSTYGAWGAGLVELANHDPEAAAGHFRRAIAMDESWVGHYELGWALVALGEYDEAVVEIGRALEMGRGALAHEFGLESTQVAFRALAGDVEGAREQLDALDDSMESGFAVGLAHAVLGDTARAFETWLERTEWTILLPAHFRYAFLPDGVRDDPRYRDVLATIDAQWNWTNDAEQESVPVFSSSTSRGTSIAVLPFDERGSEASQHVFGVGLSSEIITELSRFPNLTVISRSQTMNFTERPYDVATLAKRLGGVRYILDGSVWRIGSSVKVEAWLTDSTSGAEVWAENYKATLTDTEILGWLEELTLEVVNAIATGHGELSRAELARAGRSGPESLDSYLCVLRAYHYWHAHSAENHRVARECLESTVAADPDYAEALALLAYMYAEEYHHQWNEQPAQYDALRRGLDLARKAIQVDSASQVAHGVLALVYSFQGDRERFVVEAEETIRLNPGNSDWLAGMGTAYAQLGFFEEGTRLVRQAQALNPTPMPWLFMTLFLDRYHAGRYQEALKEALRTDTSDFRTPVFRAAAYGQLGEIDEGREELKSLLSNPATDTAEEIRELLVRRNGFREDLAELLLDGLRKAGMD